MTTFYLVRHGERTNQHDVIAGRMPDVLLSDMGQEQAAQIAVRLANVPLSALWCSPQIRTQQTAQPLAERLGLPMQISDALNELDFGEWEGKPFAEVEQEARWQPFNAFRSGISAPGGELMLETQTRIVAQMLRWREQYPDGHLALFSHGDVIRAAVMYFLGMPLDLFLRLEISVASVSTLHLSEQGVQVMCVNDTGHLSGH